MGSPASASGTGQGGSVFTPPGQPQAASQYQQLVQQLFAQSKAGLDTAGQFGLPGATAYPQALGLVNHFLTGGAGQNQALDSAQQAANYYAQVFNQMRPDTGQLNQAALGGLPYAGRELSNAFSPAYSSIVQQFQNNPYAAQALGGAQRGAQYGQQGAAGLQSAGMGLLNAGFDPQSALFNRTQGQLLDQSNVANAMSGLGGTPYGASATANALGNFDLNWQNQQLGRESQAAGAASPLLQQAPGLAAASAGLPSGAFTSNLGQILQALNQRNAAGVQGAAGFNTLLGGAGAGAANAGNLGLGLSQGLAGTGQLPYTAGANIASNGLQGLGSLVNIGNQQFTVPQQTLQDLQSYLGLGQSASGLSAQLGQMGFNQLGSGIGGALSGANALFGSNGLLSGGGLLGGGAGAAGSGLIDFGGGGAALGIPDVVGGAAAGGGLLGDLGPLALLGAPVGS